MTKNPDRPPRPGELLGVGQLSLVEHSLCPVDARASLVPALRHRASYPYTDAHGERRRARVEVFCPLGLSPTDEFYLWGLLAVTLGQSAPSRELFATPHYCLRELGVVGPRSKGGKSYRRFREALARLAAVRYQNDAFWDPTRREHRRVAMGLLSYSLPLEDGSARAWRIVWDPLFYEHTLASGGRLRFDLALYRELDPASRRLYLLLAKVLWRRKESPWFDLVELAVGVVGFAAGLPAWRLKEKLARPVAVLWRSGVIASPDVFQQRAPGRWVVRLRRGTRQPEKAARRGELASPLREPLRAVGLDGRAASRVLADYPPELVRLWSDVTLAAMERRGAGFFRKSPAAYLLDNLKAASRGGRTPPDWFLQVQKEEERRLAEAGRRESGADERRGPTRALASPDELVGCLVAGGQSPEVARRNARRLVAQESSDGIPPSGSSPWTSDRLLQK